MNLGPTELAKALGVSREMVYQYKRAGKITPESDGKYNVANVKAQLAQNLKAKVNGVPRTGDRAAAPSVPDEPKRGSLAQAQLLHETARARRAALEVQRIEGRLIDADEAAAAWSKKIASAQNKLLVIGDELGDKLAAESDPIRCREMVTDRVRAALRDVANAA